MSPLPRRRLALAATVLLPLALSACGVGQSAVTLRESITADNENVGIGQLAVRDVQVLPPPDGIYAQGSDATVNLVVINQGTVADRLTSVTSAVATSTDVVDYLGQDTTLTVPANSQVSDVQLVLRGLRSQVRPGTYVTMTLAFEVNGSRTLTVPVELTGTPAPRRSYYDIPDTDSAGNPLTPQTASTPAGGSDSGATVPPPPR